MKSDQRWAPVLLVVVLSMSGCVRIDIGDHSTSPTLGTQLIDLESAFQQGALDLAEFTRVRDALLAGNQLLKVKESLGR